MDFESFLSVNKHPTNIRSEKYLSEIVDALKAVILTALRDGYSKESYLVKNYVGYIKRTTSADNPEGYICYTAKKLLPNKESHAEKVAEVQVKYATNPDLAFKIINFTETWGYRAISIRYRYDIETIS
jgi:hypothetical protein